MHIYFNIRKTPYLTKKIINMHAYIINMHRITLNMYKMVTLQMAPHTKQTFLRLHAKHAVSFLAI